MVSSGFHCALKTRCWHWSINTKYRSGCQTEIFTKIGTFLSNLGADHLYSRDGIFLKVGFGRVIRIPDVIIWAGSRMFVIGGENTPMGGALAIGSYIQQYTNHSRYQKSADILSYVTSHSILLKSIGFIKAAWEIIIYLNNNMLWT